MARAEGRVSRGRIFAKISRPPAAAAFRNEERREREVAADDDGGGGRERTTEGALRTEGRIGWLERRRRARGGRGHKSGGRSVTASARNTDACGNVPSASTGARPLTD